MLAWWSQRGEAFLGTATSSIVDRLSHRERATHRIGEATQLRAWVDGIAVLRAAIGVLSEPCAARILFEFEIPRLGRRIDAVVLLAGVVVVVELKVGAATFETGSLAQVEDYAIDLQDFHAASRMRTIVPVLVATEAAPVSDQMPFLLGGASGVVRIGRTGLGELLCRLERQRDRTAIDVDAWEHAPYEPVPGIIEAACRLFARHDVADLARARADATNLTLTTDAIARLIDEAAAARRRIVLFVTGIPGAGKTLCGLSTTFATAGIEGAAFLTGNPSLVHVLREALVRDAVQRGDQRRAAAHRMEGVIQGLPKFRDHYIGTGQTPPERVIVIDEAQRSWSAAQAIRKSLDRTVRLTDSEPALLLDIMARHDGFAAIVCLIGNGQEIHDGEAGLAGWSDALAARTGWTVAASPRVLDAADPVSRLAGAVCDRREDSLHLRVPVRSLTHDATPEWVDAVLAGDPARAASIAAAASGRLPFSLTRDLSAFRAALRDAARDVHRSGIVASAGARRLRAEGLGVELAHTEPDAVSAWFLNSWIRDRDVRASDALEVTATQFSVQGLELDQVGLAWDGDLVRVPGRAAWEVRRFVGTAWQRAASPEKIAHRLNTYRVLLTRARYRTIVFVPRGDPADPSRQPATYDAIADFLAACGIAKLAVAPGLDAITAADLPSQPVLV